MHAIGYHGGMPDMMTKTSDHQSKPASTELAPQGKQNQGAQAAAGDAALHRMANSGASDSLPGQLPLHITADDKGHVEMWVDAAPGPACWAEVTKTVSNGENIGQQSLGASALGRQKDASFRISVDNVKPGDTLWWSLGCDPFFGFMPGDSASAPAFMWSASFNYKGQPVAGDVSARNVLSGAKGASPVTDSSAAGGTNPK